MEYVPKAITINHNPIPTYIPSALNRPSIVGDGGGGVGDAVNLEYEPSNTNREITKNGDDITGLLTELSCDQISQNGQNNGDNTENGTLDLLATASVADELNKSTEISVPTTNDESKSKENRHRSSSSSSSSRHHRHHSNSSSNSNHKTSHSDRKGSNRSSRSSSSSHRSSHHHHHSSSRKSKHSDKDKDREKPKTDDKVSISENHRSKISSTSSRHRSSNHSNKKTHSNNNHSSSNKQKEDCPSNSVVYDMNSEIDDDDDDDDVEAQCRMIFEEFEPVTANENQSDDMLTMELQATATATATKDDNGIDDTTLIRQDDATKRKRIAHDNADKQVKPIASFQRNADHVKNAMQVKFTNLNIYVTRIFSNK